MLEFNNFNGFLFIGDPHVDSRTPSKRQDLFFFNTVCEKLEQCAKICKDRSLFPLILGDLLNRKKDSDTRMIVRLIQALKTFPIAPITLIGNHEKNHTTLSDEDVLYILKETKILHTLEGSGPFARFNIQGKNILLGGTEYGRALPTNINEFMTNKSDLDEITFNEKKDYIETTKLENPDEKFDYVIWLTHHDLAFMNYAEDLVKPYAIPGIDYVVNGHIHNHYPVQKVDKTIWFNPGNITRMNIKDDEHIPAVYELVEFGSQRFKRHLLKYDKNIFKVDVEATKIEETTESAFLFTQEIKDEIGEQKTHDGSEFEKFFAVDLNESLMEPEAKNILWGIWRKQSNNNQSNLPNQ